MAREYIIIKHHQGAFLRISQNGQRDENIDLHAASESGLIREAEALINERFHALAPFPGSHWVGSKSGWYTTDSDVRES